MGRKTTYRLLCQVNLWQGYYLHPMVIPESDLFDPDNHPNALNIIKQEEITGNPEVLQNYTIADDLAIYYDPDTLRIMAGKKMRLRSENTGFSVWIQVNEPAPDVYQPYIDFDQPFKLSFYIRATNNSFLHFSNVEMGDRSIYYFSTRANNAAENTLFLNRNPIGNTFPPNYISPVDRIPFQGNILSIDVSALELESIRFVLKSATHETEFTFEKIPETDFLTICRLPLKKLPAGLFELTASSEGTGIPALTRSFYWTNHRTAKATVAVIELFFLPDEPLGPYALLNDQHQLQQPVYTLWWQNRSTRWRYIFEKDQAPPDTGNNICQVRFETPDDPKRLISKELQPLINRYREIRYCTASTNNNEEVLLPNPLPTRIYPEASEVYSEVYMGKLELDKIIQETNLE